MKPKKNSLFGSLFQKGKELFAKQAAKVKETSLLGSLAGEVPESESGSGKLVSESIFELNSIFKINGDSMPIDPANFKYFNSMDPHPPPVKPCNLLDEMS